MGYSPDQEEGEFWECKTCRVKPGSPTLCDSCLHNRRVIGDLQKRVREMEKKKKWWKRWCMT